MMRTSTMEEMDEDTVLDADVWSWNNPADKTALTIVTNVPR
jgi:hypothetical protein